ncbi:hypothetical protein [Thiolapillus sp.]|uniref:hypothetical protein n=1 Tax=Thiolapillus sp. TaxID=2017437 RepID=UPI003AF61681
MSNEEKVAAAKQALGKAVDALLELKREKPKVFYGGFAGIVLVLLIMIMMMSGGGDTSTSSPATGPAVKNLEIGKRYVLKNPNSYDPTAGVRLVITPGSMPAYDDTEKADRSGCNNLPQGTAVTVKGFYDAYGKKNSFVNVQIEDGECKGRSMWTLAINVQ